jgi:hypothetical protein
MWRDRGGRRSRYAPRAKELAGARSRNSFAGSTPMTLHHRIEVLNQCPRVERLTQDAGCSGFQCLRPDSLFGESRDENHRQLAPLCLQKILQLDAAHTRHLNVRDHAGGMIQLWGSQKFACRRKCSGNVSKRAHEPVSRGAHGCIIINDRNHGVLTKTMCASNGQAGDRLATLVKARIEAHAARGWIRRRRTPR